MRTQRPRAVGLTLLVWLAHASTAWSYQCCQPRTVAEELRQARAIFVGRVTAIEPLPEPGELVDGLQTRQRVVFAIERSWRGVSDTAIVPIAVPSVGGTGYGYCGIELKLGETYLVYAYGQDELRTRIESRGIGRGAGSCSRTRPLAQAGEDLAVLDGKAGQKLMP